MNLPNSLQNIPGALKSAGSFIFGGNTGQSYEDMKRQRAMAQLLAARVASGSPQNVGQGLQAITGALVSRKLGERADKNATAGRERVQSALGTILQGRLGGTPYAPSAGAAYQPPSASLYGPVADVYVPQNVTMPGQVTADVSGAFAGAGGGLPGSLIQTESGGNLQALNSEGYGGRGQFGADRLADAARAGVIPAGMTGLSYSQAPEAVQQAVETWHVGDVMKDLGQYVGVDPDGAGPIPPLDQGSILAVAHLGGKGGAKKFIESGGAYNPSDSNGTSLADYAIKHANGGNAMAFAGGNPDLSFVSQMGGGGIDPQLMAVMNDPYVSELPEMQQSALGALFQRQLGMSDPLQQLQMQKAQLELEQMRNPGAPPPMEINGQLVDPRTGQVMGDYRTQEQPDTPASVQEYEYYVQQTQARGEQPMPYEQFSVEKARAGATNVTTQIGNGSKFNEKSDELAAARMGEIVVGGQSATSMMADLQQLAQLSTQINTGKGAQVIAALGPYAEAMGVKIDGLGEAQAYDAIISRMAPQMRPVGSGATSDFDARQFLKSLPSLGNSPEGNAVINETFQSIQQHKMAAANIAMQAQQGAISWQDADKQIAKLGNPYERFNSFNKQRGAAPQAGASGSLTRAQFEALPGVQEIVGQGRTTMDQAWQAYQQKYGGGAKRAPITTPDGYTIEAVD